VTLACGPLFRSFGGEAYAAMAMLALIGSGAAFLLMQRWRGGLIVANEPAQPQSAEDEGNTMPAS
jgi:hypothetical protein